MNLLLQSLFEAGCISALSFYFARFVAHASNRKVDSVVALSAALVSERNQRGDVCVRLSDFAGKALFEGEQNPALSVPVGPTIDDWLANLRAQPGIGKPGDTKPLILDGERLYLHKFWHFETTLHEAVAKRLQPRSEPATQDSKAVLARLFPNTGGGVVDWQKVAAAATLTRGLTVISGGPGTGKTTTVVKILALLLELDPDLHLKLAAPTGKAAARLGDAIRLHKQELSAREEIKAAIPEQAATIHRLLGYNGRRFRHHRSNPIILDCLILDEASMVDLPLMARLFEALPIGARVILLGDRDQLASVEAGSVLGDLTGHGRPLFYSPSQAQTLSALTGLSPQCLPADPKTPAIADAIALLRTSYRFTGHSGIGNLAKAVNEGKASRALDICRGFEFEEVAWIEGGENAVHPDALRWAAEHYAQYLRANDIRDAFTAFERARVLCAMHNGPFGTVEFNRLVEQTLCGEAPSSDGEAFHGKPIMITVNDYDADLFNGDIGLLWRSPQGELRAFFKMSEDRVRDIPIRSLPDHVAAWALTVHKSQGSEFAHVLLVLPTDTDNKMLNRELIYTGITRAGRTITIHAGPQSLTRGVARRVKRSSGLAEKLGWAASPPPK